MPENYITSETESGNICLSEDVILVMVNAAVAEIEGVSRASNPIGAANDIAEFLGIKNTPNKNVKISTGEDGTVSVDVVIMVRYGYPVTTVAKAVQDRVLDALEGMGGIKCRVNVHVSGIAFEKTDVKG